MRCIFNVDFELSSMIFMVMLVLYISIQYDLRIRSSISRKGLIFMNGCGVIDSDYYPNDIGIIVCNLSGQSIKLSGGTRVAQRDYRR